MRWEGAGSVLVAVVAAVLAVAGCRAGVHAGNDGGTGGLGSPDGAGGARFDGPTIDGLGGFDGGAPVQLTACGYYGLGQVGAAAVSSDGKLLAIAALDFVAIVDVATKTIRHKLPAPGSPIAFALSPDGQYVGVGGWSGYYRIWRIADETMVANVPTPIQQMAFSPDGHQLMVIANGTPTLSTYQFPSLVPQWTAPNTAGAAYAPDGSFIVSASGTMFDPATGAKLGSLGDVPDVYYGLGVAVSSTGVVLLSDDNHGVLELWRASDRTLIGSIATGRTAGGGGFSPDGKRLVGFDSSTKAVKVWSVPDGAVVGQYPLDSIHRGIAAVSFSASGAVIAAISDPPSVRLIDIDAGGKDLLTYAWGHSDVVWHAEVSPDGKLIATATGTDTEVDIWNLATSELITTLSDPNGAWDLRFSPDGRNLYVAGKTLDEWRVSDWTLTRQTAEGRGGVSGVAVSPDGMLLATGAHYDAIKIWRRADMTPLVTIPLSDNGGTPLAFSGDGTLLGTFADAMHPAVYRVSDGMLLGKYPGGIQFWSSTSDQIAFTPDGGELLVIGEGLDALSVPDLGLRGELANIDTLYTFALAPAGKQLVISDLEVGIQLWDLPTRTLTGVGLFDGLALRSLALSFVPGDVKRIVTSNLDAVRLYCRPAQDTWIVE